jgi:hypothetical protein
LGRWKLVKAQFNAVVHSGLIVLYGFTFFFTLLDIVTTKVVLSSGGFEANVVPAWLFATVRFGNAVIIKLLGTAVMFGVTEILFRFANKSADVDPENALKVKQILFVGWLIIAISLFIVVLNNVEVLKELGYF